VILTWLFNAKLRRIQSVCELALAHLGWSVPVRVARTQGLSPSGSGWLVIIDTSQPIEGDALIGLAGHLRGVMWWELEMEIEPGLLVVCSIDSARAAVLQDRGRSKKKIIESLNEVRPTQALAVKNSPQAS